MMLKRASLFAVLLCAGIAAAGCASSPKSPAEPADESAQFAPVNYLDICLLENNEVKSPKLVDAIESGFRKAGANVKRLRAGSGPDACSFVVTYEVPNNQGSVNVIRYQTYEHGIPRVDATGSAPQGRALTVQAVEAYSAELLSKLAHKKRASKAASPQCRLKSDPRTQLPTAFGCGRSLKPTAPRQRGRSALPPAPSSLVQYCPCAGGIESIGHVPQWLRLRNTPRTGSSSDLRREALQHHSI